MVDQGALLLSAKLLPVNNETNFVLFDLQKCELCQKPCYPNDAILSNRL